MRINGKVFVLGLLLLPALAFAAPGLSDLGKKNPGKSIAVVSLSANNYGGALGGWNDATGSDLMGSRLNTMLELTEERLAEDWTVVKAETFVANPDFQALKGVDKDVGLPMLNDNYLPLFCKDRKQLVKATIDQDLAKQLCEITGANYILVIYSEWSVATGNMVPTSKALAKNVLSVYDAKGKSIFSGRVDEKGAKNLGANGYVVVNEKTIDQWVDAYERGIAKLFKKK